MWVSKATKRPDRVWLHLPLIAWMALGVISSGMGPPQVTAASRRVPVRSVRNIALSERGELQGVVVDARGRGLSGREVVVRRARQTMVRVRATRDGHFSARGLTSGLYVISSGTVRQLVRVWSTSSAPPRTPHRLVLVDEPRIVRGQSPTGGTDSLGMLLLSGEVMAISLVFSDNRDLPLVSP